MTVSRAINMPFDCLPKNIDLRAFFDDLLTWDVTEMVTYMKVRSFVRSLFCLALDWLNWIADGVLTGSCQCMFISKLER